MSVNCEHESYKESEYFLKREGGGGLTGSQIFKYLHYTESSQIINAIKQKKL